jgi:hypothetical protein
MSRTELRLVTAADDEATRVVPLCGHPSGQGPAVETPVLRVVPRSDEDDTPDDAA